MFASQSRRKRPARDLREGQHEGRKIEVKPVDLEPTRRGYQVTYNYAIQFWLPVLGPRCFCVWQALISFCYGDRDTCWPSISLLAEMAARGNRHLVTGRWRRKGEKRRRQKGALEKLEDHGLLTVEKKHTGRETRYTFHVLKEPPLLSPELLARLPERLQQMHADLLDRCGLDLDTYQHVHQGGSAQGIGGGVQDIRGGVQDTRGGVQDTTKHYKRSKTIEEVWKEAKNALSREMTRSNFRTYLADTQPLTFDRSSGILFVQTSDSITAQVLARRFHTTIKRAVHNLHLAVDEIPIQDVQFRSGR